MKLGVAVVLTPPDGRLIDPMLLILLPEFFGSHKASGRKKTGHPRVACFFITSLAVTYFRMGIHTIIGAEAFHCPVRDGKEWDHHAIAAKLDLSPCSHRD